MESFVFSIFHKRSQFQRLEVREFADEYTALQNIPPHVNILSVDGGRVTFVKKSTYDTALWRRVLFSPERRRLDAWSPDLRGDWAHQASTQLNFYQWMQLMWRLHSSHLPPIRPVYLPVVEMPSSIEDPYQYMLREMKTILSEYDEGDVEALCKSRESYTQIIAFVGEAMKLDTSKLSETVDAIHKVFEKMESLKKDNIAYRDQEARLIGINTSVAEANQTLEREYIERMRVYNKIVDVISEFYAQQSDGW